MSEAMEQAKPQEALEVQEETSLLDQIIKEGRIGRDETQHSESRLQIAKLVEEVMKGEIRIAKDIEATIGARIKDIDALLSRQLNEIMHAPEFQKLEASWRGLHYLVQQSETSTMLKLRVLNAPTKISLETWSAPANLTRARCSRKCMRRNTARLVGRRLAPCLATMSSAVIPRI